MAEVGQYDLRIQQGATFRRVFTWYTNYVSADHEDNETADLEDFTARLQARVRPGDAPVIDLIDGSGITLDEEAGTITVLLTDEQTEALDFLEARYDLELESAGGEVTRLLEGRVVLSPEVTDEDSSS